MEHFAGVQDTSFKTSLSAVIIQNFAVIQFDMDRQVTWANDLFLQTMGYSKEELLHQRHKIFMPPEDTGTAEYRLFWDNLRSNKTFNGRIRRITSKGQDVWLETRAMRH